MKRYPISSTLILLLILWGCSNKKSDMTEQEYKPGTFGFDYTFLKKYQKGLVLLQDSATKGVIILSPAYQGRVMTSSVNGMESRSNGWINFDLIKSGKTTNHMNAYGGEERLWLGPEGGQFSLYFEAGKKQEFENWQVPAILDTLPFKLVSYNATSANFIADLNLKNYSGTSLIAKVERKVKLLSILEIEKLLGQRLTDSLYMVAYQSDNTITNSGDKEWNTLSGMPSIWMLSMLYPSPEVVIFIPYQQGEEKTLGKIVNDDYFGKVPKDRLKKENGIIYFKADGKHRSKIGISPKRAAKWAASYDASRNALTLLYCASPQRKTYYVNSKWGNQEDPFSGDAINAYNDGPVDDGTQMGPFYELESSSPAANLKPGEKLNHIQTIIHIEGPENKLDQIVRKLFSISLNEVKNTFSN